MKWPSLEIYNIDHLCIMLPYIINMPPYTLAAYKLRSAVCVKYGECHAEHYKPSVLYTTSAPRQNVALVSQYAVMMNNSDPSIRCWFHIPIRTQLHITSMFRVPSSHIRIDININDQANSQVSRPWNWAWETSKFLDGDAHLMVQQLR